MARTTRRPPSRRWRTSCYRLGPSPGWDAFSQEEILQHELPLQAVAHASGLFRIRVRLFGCASSARWTTAHSADLCPAHAFTVWSPIARAALRTARRVCGRVNGQEH